MPKRSDEYMLERRLEIAEAALRCFARVGYHETSIPDICKEAKVSVGTLYKHFEGKSDMWMASWDSFMMTFEWLKADDGWPASKAQLIAGIASLDDKQSLGIYSSSLELTADALRGSDYAKRAEAAITLSRQILMNQLQHLANLKEISMPLGVEITERMIRSLISGAMNQFIWEASLSAKQLASEVSQTLDRLVGYEK